MVTTANGFFESIGNDCYLKNVSVQGYLDGYLMPMTPINYLSCPSSPYKLSQAAAVPGSSDITSSRVACALNYNIHR